MDNGIRIPLKTKKQKKYIKSVYKTKSYNDKTNNEDTKVALRYFETVRDMIRSS